MAVDKTVYDTLPYWGPFAALGAIAVITYANYLSKRWFNENKKEFITRWHAKLKKDKIEGLENNLEN